VSSITSTHSAQATAHVKAAGTTTEPEDAEAADTTPYSPKPSSDTFPFYLSVHVHFLLASRLFM